MEKEPALVGIVKDEKQWDLIKNKRWYHLPVLVNSAPEKPELIKCIAFYFPKNTWQLVDIGSAVLFFVSIFNRKKP